jgi:hypothetical protein
MSFLALLHWPYGYYQLLRVVVFAVCAYHTYIYYSRVSTKGEEIPSWVWALGGIAILFNPFVPVHLPREIWMVFNIITGLVLIKSVRWGRKL